MADTWMERAHADPSLRAFVDAEIARAHVELESLRVEVKHWKETVAAKDREIVDLKQDRKNDSRHERRGKPSERAAR